MRAYYFSQLKCARLFAYTLSAQTGHLFMITKSPKCYGVEVFDDVEVAQKAVPSFDNFLYSKDANYIYQEDGKPLMLVS